jgi:hypothetical protein
MAVKIHTNGMMSFRKPLSAEKYSISELAIELETTEQHLRLLDMGPFLLVVDDSKTEVNSIASIFFRFKVSGTVLLVAGNECSDEEFLTAENTKYLPDDVDAGIIKSIKDTCTVYQMVMNNDNGITESPATKSVYYYDPEKNEDELGDDEESFTEEFYQSAFTRIKQYSEISNDLKLVDLVLLEDKDLIVKFPPDAKKIETIIQKMINYFVSVEEYEKCKLLKNTLKESQDNQRIL